MMPLRLVLFLCAILLGSACTAPASRTALAPEAVSTVSAASGDPESAAAEEVDPLVCKSAIRTGTRVATRTCMRRSQQEKTQRDAHEMLEGVQRRSVQAGNQTKD